VKHLDDPDLTQLTRSGDLLGTPKYMSPEQAQGIPADVRSDIYSFGIVAYETLVGAVPFTGSEREILQQQIHETPTAPSVHGVVLPATLEAMMLKCLEKCRDRRFQSADEVVAILHNVLSELRDIHSPFESDWSCTAEDSDRCGSDAIPEPSDAGMAIANQPPNQSVSDASAPFNGSVTVVPQDGGTPARDQSCDIDEQTVAQSIDAVELSSGTSQSSIVADPREHDRRSPYSADLWIGQAPVVSSRWQVTGDQTVPALVIESVITHTPRRPRSSRIRAQVAAAVMACVGVIVSAVWTTTTLRDPVRSDVRPPLVHAEPPTERVHQSYNEASPSAVEQRALAKSAMVAVNRPNESKSHRPVRDSQADNQEVAASADVSRDVPTRATNTWPSNNAVSERRPDNYGANAVRTSAMPTEPTAATTFVSMGGAISRRSMADLLADKKSTPIDKSMRSTIDQTFGNHPDVVWASNAPTVDQLRTFPDPLNRKAGPEQIGVPLISLGVRFKKRWPFLTPRMGN
jgi:hypothetical protein